MVPAIELYLLERTLVRSPDGCIYKVSSYRALSDASANLSTRQMWSDSEGYIIKLENGFCHEKNI